MPLQLFNNSGDKSHGEGLPSRPPKFKPKARAKSAGLAGELEWWNDPMPKPRYSNTPLGYPGEASHLCHASHASLPDSLTTATNTLSGGSFSFSEPLPANSPARFYRIRSP
jgi:hypothetical protein